MAKLLAQTESLLNKIGNSKITTYYLANLSIQFAIVNSILLALAIVVAAIAQTLPHMMHVSPVTFRA